MSVRLGYVAINVTLRSQGIFTNRTMRVKTVEEKGTQYIKELAMANLNDLLTIINWNEKHGIRFFRLGAGNIFAHIENPRIATYDIDFALDKLKEIGALVRALGHRLTCHPAQFAQLGSPRADVVEQTIRDLNLHAKIFLSMELTPSFGSVMIIHAGGMFGNRDETLSRWKDNFRKMPPTTQQYVTLENDEHYNVLQLLPVCEELNVPLCVDYFHHTLYGINEFDIYDDALTRRVINTWKSRGIKPKCHWSQQEEGKRRGTHSNEVNFIDERLLCLCSRYDCDIMIESKDKELNVERMHDLYFNKNYGANDYVYWTLKDQYVCRGP